MTKEINKYIKLIVWVDYNARIGNNPIPQIVRPFGETIMGTVLYTSL